MKWWGWLGVLLVVLYGATSIYGKGLRNGRADVQSQWDAQRLKTAQATTDLFVKLNDATNKARKETEAIRANYIEYKAGKERETDDLQRAVAAGAKRLSVRASCPAASVPRAGTNASGIDSRAAVLDADAGQDYYAYRRAYDEQYGLLTLCRDELRKRSGSYLK